MVQLQSYEGDQPCQACDAHVPFAAPFCAPTSTVSSHRQQKRISINWHTPSNDDNNRQCRDWLQVSPHAQSTPCRDCSCNFMCRSNKSRPLENNNDRSSSNAAQTTEMNCQNVHACTITSAWIQTLKFGTKTAMLWLVWDQYLKNIFTSFIAILSQQDVLLLFVHSVVKVSF